MKPWGRFTAWLDDPTSDRRIHGALALVWLALVWPSITAWKNSIPYLVAVSVYAIVASHYAGWQAAKAEDRVMEMAANVASIKRKMNELVKLVEEAA